MKHSWFKSVFPIAAIFSFRMLGLFMLIPVFTIYASQLKNATPSLIGLALGAYGLSQGLLQIPFGMLSDRYGRKPILAIGLCLFVLGSLLGAVTTSIYGMMLARIIQGMGAIGSVLIALLADLTPDEQRTKAMAVIGASIGISFSIAMVISPVLTHHFGLSGIFYLTAFLATLGLVLLYLVIPTPTIEPFHLDSGQNPRLFKHVLTNMDLQRLNIGIFCQHFILTASFYTVPMLLERQIHLGTITKQWHFYLPLMLVSFVLMLPLLTLAEKKRKIKPLFLTAVATTAISQLALSFTYPSWLAISSFMFIYFIGFNFLEASLPSMISRQVNPESKGSAMGVYSSCQFLGIFAGGTLAGLVYQMNGTAGIFMVNALIALFWFLIACFIKPNLYQLTLIIPVASHAEGIDIVGRLLLLPGVERATLARGEHALYLRIDKHLYQEGSAEALLQELSAATV